MYFVILNRLGVDHECDGQKDQERVYWGVGEGVPRHRRTKKR